MDGIEMMLKSISEARKKNATNMTLGEFIDVLKEIPEGSQIIYKAFGCLPGKLASYRGYYEDLALDVLGPEYNKAIPVSEVLKECEEAIGKVFTGWKGGDYEASRDTLLWASNTGSCTNMAIIAVEECYEGMWEIITLEVD